MPYTIPTLRQLQSQAQQDIASADLPGVDGLLRRSVLLVLSYVMAGFAYLHFGYQAWIARMSVPWTARDEFAAGWGALKGVTRKPATAASGVATFTGTAGVVAPAGTVLRRSDGATYTSTAEATVDSGGSIAIPATADDLGAAGNAEVGVVIALGNSITGINATGAVSTRFAGGADIEDPEDFRDRYLEVYADPPQGGSEADYVKWAREVSGVTRAWAKGNAAGVGTVVVWFMMDDTNAGTEGYPVGTDGVAADEPRATAATGDQLAVADYISTVRPATALVYAAAPVAQPIAFTITDLSPATAAIKAGIAEALADLFRRQGDPTGATVYPNEWNAAIESVEGIRTFTVSSPVAPVTLATGRLPALGTLTWG